MGKKVRLTITPEDGNAPSNVREDALEKLKELNSIEAVDSVIGYVGNRKRRNFSIEKKFDK